MAQADTARILVVDDDVMVARSLARFLEKHDFKIDCAQGAEDAIKLIKENQFDVILSDINMPGINGLEFFRMIRGHDLDVPIVLMTGEPSVATAIQALEQGAMRYLLKPVDTGTLLEVVYSAVRLHKLAILKRRVLTLSGDVEKQFGDWPSLEIVFEKALNSIWMAYQPVICWSKREIFGYEALVRTKEEKLMNPANFFHVAERLGKVHVLGQAIRENVSRLIQAKAPPGAILVNLHTKDLNDPSLFDALSPLSNFAPQVILEITERASLEEITDVPNQVSSLRKLGYRLAVDDLGAGYAGLSSFTLLNPEIVKLDMELIRNIDTHTTKRKVVSSMIALCKDLDIIVIAEGIETIEERDTLAKLGCDLFQGYLFARPGEAFPVAKW